MLKENETLTFRKIFVFWVPLAATWLMMSFEGPFLAAIIARLAEPKFNLAAYGVAFSFALIAEAPIIMIMSASAALVKDRDSYIKLSRFTLFLNTVITVVILLVIIPSIFNFLAMDLIGLPREVSRLTHISLVLLIPWPAAIGFRRLYQGLLIRANLTRRVAYGTIVRLCTMVGTAIVLYLSGIKGAYVGAAALSMGVTLEAVVSRFMARSTIHSLLSTTSSQESLEKKSRPLTYRFISKFYYPLAMTSILALGVHPMVTFFMGKSRFPIESLAVLPVVNALVFIFRSLGLSYQEVVIVLLGSDLKEYKILKKFAIILGAGLVCGLSLIVFTPLAKIWFFNVSGLSIELSMLSYLPAQILMLLPGLTVLISFQRSILVNTQNTGPITWASSIEVVIIIGVLFISIYFLDVVGAVAAACAYTLGRIGANAYLYRFQTRSLRKASF
jgi:hypothetical protein